MLKPKPHALGFPKGCHLLKIGQHKLGWVGLTKVKGQSKKVILSTAFSHQSPRHIRVWQVTPAPSSREGHEERTRRRSMKTELAFRSTVPGRGWRRGGRAEDWAPAPLWPLPTETDPATPRRQPVEGQGMGLMTSM